VTSARQAIEALSVKVGAVVLVLGVLHLLNLVVLSKLRRRAQQQLHPTMRPPVAPDAMWGIDPRQAAAAGFALPGQ